MLCLATFCRIGSASELQPVGGHARFRSMTVLKRSLQKNGQWLLQNMGLRSIGDQ